MSPQEENEKRSDISRRGCGSIDSLFFPLSPSLFNKNQRLIPYCSAPMRIGSLGSRFLSSLLSRKSSGNQC